MRSIPFLVAVTLLLAGCQDAGQRSVGVLRTGGDFAVTRIDGRPAPTGVTMTITDSGRVNGAGPCSLYTAQLTQWGGTMTLSGLTVTPRACPNPADKLAEAQFRRALSTVVAARAGADRAQVSLTDAEGRTRLHLLGRDKG